MPANLSSQSQRRRTKTKYGAELEEKQNLKSIYGIRDHQLKNYYRQAYRSHEETGKKMVILLEQRLDNAVFRAGLAVSRKQARQMVGHALFQVNDKSVDIPSYQLKTGDKVKVKSGKRNKSYFTNFAKRLQNTQPPSWLELSVKDFGFHVTGEPSPQEANIGVAIQDVTEFLAR